MESLTPDSPFSSSGAITPPAYSLTGSYSVRLSGGRARLVLPAVWREQIEGPVKVGPCPYREGVRLYPRDEFARIVTQLHAEQLEGQSWARQLTVWLGRHFYEVSPDSAGRIEIPSVVVAGFTWPAKDEVVLTGGHTYIIIEAPVAEGSSLYVGLPDHIPAWI
jgi:DNA-binding transcriptional regulator/RsmH inhibitor MraZ